MKYNLPPKVINSFKDATSQLFEYDEFDHEVFVGDKMVSQDLCSFILTLTLIYNDLKYLHISLGLIDGSQKDATLRRMLGEYAGFRLYLLRLNVGLIHELLEFIKSSEKLLNESFMLEIIKSMDSRSRRSWNDIVEAAFNKETKNNSLNPFYMIRTKIVFHYDKDELMSGFKRGFIGVKEKPCISRGITMINSRFYFSDRAVEAYLRRRTDMEPEEFLARLDKLNVDTTLSLINLCTSFIIKRGGIWKKGTVQ
jgi:hypothetical protein